MLVATRRRREDWLEGNEASSNTTIEEKAWKSPWRVDVPAKIQTFLW